MLQPRATSIAAAASHFADGLYEAALPAYEAAVAEASVSADAGATSRALRGLASTLLKLGRNDRALVEARRARGVDPLSAPTLFTLGAAELALEHGAASRAALTQCVERALLLVPTPEHLLTTARAMLASADELVSEDSPAPEGEAADMAAAAAAASADADASAAVASAAQLETVLAALPAPAAAAPLAAHPTAADEALAAAAGPVAAAAPARPRYEWYQTPTHVTVSLLAKGALEAASRITVLERGLSVHLAMLEGSAPFELQLALCGAVKPSVYAVSFRPSKVELRLAKAADTTWPRLEGAADGAAAPPPPPPPAAGARALAAAAGPPTPYSSKRDWSAIGRSLDAELKVDPALQNMDQLMQTIYKSGDLDAQRAMNKSYQLSGGTVLSTNWKDVAKREFEHERKTGDLKPTDDATGPFAED